MKIRKKGRVKDDLKASSLGAHGKNDSNLRKQPRG